MKIDRAQIKSFLVWFVISFVVALITGWGIFGVITKDMVINSILSCTVCTLFFQLFFIQKSKKDSSV